MSNEITYLEINAEAGLAEVSFSMSQQQVINVTVTDDVGMHNDSAILELGETHDKAYFGDLGKIAHDHSQSPHVTDVFVEKDPIYPIDYLKFKKGDINYLITDIPKANGVLSGGTVGWVEGLKFSISNTAYYVEGELYTSISTTVTHDVADTVYSRLDLICLNILSQAVILKGIPSANPQKPTPNPLTQIELTVVLIPANAIEPELPIDQIVIYDENIEWTATAIETTINPNATLLPFKGSKCFEVTNIGNNDTIVFTKTTVVDASTYPNLIFSLKLKEVMSSQYSMSIQLYDNSFPRSNEYIFSFGKTVQYVNVWQTIAIPLTTIGLISGIFNRVVFKMFKQGQQIDFSGFFLDYIRLEKGIAQPPSGVETDPVFTSWKNSMYGIGAKKTGIDAGTIHQRSITDDYEYVCIQSGAAGIAIWKKIVLFQT